jgi:MFS family permease
VASRETRRTGLIWLAFLESLAAILLQRGIYFYAHSLFRYTEAQNLLLALVVGVSYVAGALSSHAIALRAGERRAIVANLACVWVAHVTLAGFPKPAVVTALFPVVAFLQGMKWPIVESFVSAGLTPSEVNQVLARYNVVWSLSVPVAVSISGPLIASPWPWTLFALPAAINIVGLLLSLRLPLRPLHIELHHPERPPAEALARCGSLMLSSRWSLIATYSLLFLLAPLLPTVFDRFELSVRQATFCAALIDVARPISFAALGYFTGWQGRAAPLTVLAMVLPVGFAMVLFGSNLGTVLVGEALFGLFAGLAYYASLYYSMVVKNASVDAAAGHESVIGLGFAIGPAVGLLGQEMNQILGTHTVGMLAGVIPLVTVCILGALRPLSRLRARATVSG